MGVNAGVEVVERPAEPLLVGVAATVPVGLLLGVATAVCVCVSGRHESVGE